MTQNNNANLVDSVAAALLLLVPAHAVDWVAVPFFAETATQADEHSRPGLQQREHVHVVFVIVELHERVVASFEPMVRFANNT